MRSLHFASGLLMLGVGSIFFPDEMLGLVLIITGAGTATLARCDRPRKPRGKTKA